MSWCLSRAVAVSRRLRRFWPSGYPLITRGTSVQLRLTDKNIPKIEAPKSGRIEIADALFPGLTLRVTDTGKKTWTLLYRVDGARDGRLKGKLRRMTLGPYPLNSVDAARDKAREALKKAERGIDPVDERQAELNSLSATTFEAVCERFIALYAKLSTRNRTSRLGQISRDCSGDTLYRPGGRAKSAPSDVPQFTNFWTTSSSVERWAALGRCGSTCPSCSTGRSTGECWTQAL